MCFVLPDWMNSWTVWLDQLQTKNGRFYVVDVRMTAMVLTGNVELRQNLGVPLKYLVIAFALSTTASLAGNVIWDFHRRERYWFDFFVGS